jgi:hypothetical protein
MQWDELSNGNLLAAAEAAGFQAMITGDQNIGYQQNNDTRTVSLIVISQTKRNIVTAHSELIDQAIGRAHPGSYEVVNLPKPQRKGIRALS